MHWWSAPPSVLAWISRRRSIVSRSVWKQRSLAIRLAFSHCAQCEVVFTASLKSPVSDLHFTHTPTSPTPLPPLNLRLRSVYRMWTGSSNDRRLGSFRPRWCFTCLFKSLLWPTGPIFTQIFNRSLELCEVPCCFKHSTIIPVPKNPKSLALSTLRLWSRSHLRDWFGLSERHHWTLAGSISVCIQNKQVCGWCSQHGTTLYSAISRQT